MRGFPTSVARTLLMMARTRTADLDFLEKDPRECWSTLFADQGARIAESGLGRVSFAAPFIPTIPGSDRYTDELW